MKKMNNKIFLESKEYSHMIRGCKEVEIPYLDYHLQLQNKNDNILLVGERMATEGILQNVLDREYNKIVCTDIMELRKDSPLDEILKTNKKVSFIQEDFIEADENQKYEYIACINVLEHFGMNFAQFSGFAGVLAGDDYIRWNHDLRAIKKMINLLSKNPNSKIIITVPAGPPVLPGDVNYEDEGMNLMPKLRRYDILRIEMIHKMIAEEGLNLSENFYYSPDFEDWYETNNDITHWEQLAYHIPSTPNAIWAFTITR